MGVPLELEEGLVRQVRRVVEPVDRRRGGPPARAHDGHPERDVAGALAVPGEAPTALLPQVLECFGLRSVGICNNFKGALGLG